jgi:hypothetical protein
MALVKPPLATVEPGRPVTAQGWNAIIGGLGELYDAVLAFGTGVLQVSVLAGGAPVRGAQVVGTPIAGGNPVGALPLYGDVQTYALVGVTPGNWRVFVTAPGFRPEVRDATVPVAAPLVIDLTAAGVAMPDLFGLAAKDALSRLTAANIQVDQILDVLGRDVSRVALPPQYQNSPVLMQMPVAGSVVDTQAQGVRLLLAASLEPVATVTMPSLIGLTHDEVARVLNDLGLRLGTVTVRRPGEVDR